MDDDVLENGPRRPRRGRRTLAAVACVAVLALLALVRFGDVVHEPHRPPATAQPPPSTPEPLPWPSAKGACGMDVELPLVSARRLRERTGLRVLVGGARLARVDVDSGRTQVLDEQQTHELFVVGRDTYAVGQRGCGLSEARVLRVPASGPPRRVELRHVEDVLAGSIGLYGVDYRSGSNRTLLRPLVGRAVGLAAHAEPVGLSAAGVVATLPGEGLVGRPTIVLLDRRTGAIARTIGRGTPWAVGARTLLWTDRSCRYLPSEGTGVAPCLLRATALADGGRDATYRLPAGRIPTSVATFGRGERYVAFQLGRARPEPRYTHQHPMPESDVVVLDLATGGLEEVPGLELAPKTQVGLSFSPDARWLVLATNQGDHGNVYLWRRGTPQLLSAPVFLTGPPAGGVPVVVTS